MIECRRCGALLPDSAAFCGNCGTSVRTVRAVVAEQRSERRAGARSAMAVACIVALLPIELVWRTGEDSWHSIAIELGWATVVAAIAIAVLGREQLRDSVPMRVAPRWCAVAVPTAALTVVVSMSYTGLLAVVWPSPVAAVVPETSGWETVAAVLVAPLVEEVLCRGVAWRAIVRLAGPRVAILGTALLFALFHLLNGWLVLELPHRFVGGLALGWLRQKSGSLVPGIVAHALHNALAIALVR